jgi:hypothetical protein
MPIFSYYKIVSKDENIKEIYIGKTKNFKRRVKQHKNRCNNENDKCYNLKVYQYIRENGGWDNFDMIEIETNEYDNKKSAIRERELIEELNATLNNDIPSRTKQEYRENNKEKIKEKHKEYRENNKEKIKEKDKEYRDKNREKEKQRVKDYYDKNRESILCECGGKYHLFNKARHLKTKKHQDYLLNEIN